MLIVNKQFSVRPIIVVIALAIGFVSLSCSHREEKKANELLRYGENIITLEEVNELIPGGLSPADSAALFHKIIEGWIRENVLAALAEERLYDLAAIDRKVSDYRNSLIVQEYLTRMRESHVAHIDEDKIREYYNQYRQELKLEVPLVKGIFIKINAESNGQEEIKQLLTSDDPESIDRLEQQWLDRAIEYNYFKDKWIDWETIRGLIPYRFGDPDKFLAENQYFETRYGDCAYYLRISDYMPTGEIQPLEFARNWITEVLTQGELSEYENTLVASLVKKAIGDHKLEALGYDPLKHELKQGK